MARAREIWVSVSGSMDPCHPKMVLLQSYPIWPASKEPLESGPWSTTAKRLRAVTSFVGPDRTKAQCGRTPSLLYKRVKSNRPTASRKREIPMPLHDERLRPFPGRFRARGRRLRQLLGGEQEVAFAGGLTHDHRATERQSSVVTLLGPGGEYQVVRVRNPAYLKNVVVGDQVVITYIPRRWSRTSTRQRSKQLHQWRMTCSSKCLRRYWSSLPRAASRRTSSQPSSATHS